MCLIQNPCWSVEFGWKLLRQHFSVHTDFFTHLNEYICMYLVYQLHILIHTISHIALRYRVIDVSLTTRLKSFISLALALISILRGTD